MYMNKGDTSERRRGLSIIQRTTGDALHDATKRGSLDKDAARMAKESGVISIHAIILTEPKSGNLIISFNI